MVGAPGATPSRRPSTGRRDYDPVVEPRRRAGADTDSNAHDFSLAAPTPTAGAPAALALTNPGAKNGTVGVADHALQLAATGGTPPYT